MSEQSDIQEGWAETPAERGYWDANIRLMVTLLAVWIVISYGVGVFLRDVFNNIVLFGEPLGVWFAKEGAAYMFLALVAVYCVKTRRLERAHLRDKGAPPNPAD